MMLSRQFSARACSVLVLALILAAFILTARRLHRGSTAPIPRPEVDPLKALENDQPVGHRSPHSQTTWTSFSQVTKTQANVNKFCDQDIEFLRRADLALTDNIVYTRRCVRPVRGHVDRDVVANVSSSLFKGTTVLNLRTPCSENTPPPPCEPLTLHVPPAYPQQHYPQLIFGVASTYDRLNDSLPEFAHWLSNTGAKLIAVVADADHPPDPSSTARDLAPLQAAYRALDIDATFLRPSLTTALPRKDTSPHTPPSSPPPIEQLHFLLIRDLLAHSTPHTQWLGIIDDDTFFPALYPLAARLAPPHHDASRPAWVGALSDNWNNVRIWGFMAFGGAGTFLSVPLARGLERELEECLRETEVGTGDGMLRDCVYRRGGGGVRLELMKGLGQFDLRGDVAGVVEGARPVGGWVSLHHWKSWFSAPVSPMAAITHICGGCFLQRFRLGADTLLVNGYSISVYREGLLGQLDLNKVEATWQEVEDVTEEGIGAGGEDFEYAYGPFRPRLGEKDKKSYRLVAVDWGPEGRGSGRLRQVYVHRSPREGRGSEERVMDEIVELVWEG